MTKDAIHSFGFKDIKKKSIFGTDGIRGNAKQLFTPESVFQIGYSFGFVLPNKGPILIGQDSRESCSMITAALETGLTYAGREVWKLGLCPTPAVPLLIKELNASGGIMVSASHNQPQDNGIKVFSSHGNKISSKEKIAIEEILSNQIFECERFGKSYIRNDLLEKYEQSLIASIGSQNLQKIRVVLDLCHGSATPFGGKIFQSLGAEVIVINGEADGEKINVGCGSTNLQPLIQAVLENKAHMGFAFDGDADRVIAVDEKGRILNGDHILYLWGSYLKEKKELEGNRLVATIMSNLGFEESWVSKGGILERTLVGDQFVHAKMIASKASLGGEQSGHILSKINGFCGDGLLTSLQLCSISKTINLRLSEWLNQSFIPYPQKLINVPISNNKTKFNWESYKPLKDLINKAELALGKNGRILIRESGTEPLLRVMVESKDKTLVDLWGMNLEKFAEKNFNAA